MKLKDHWAEFKYWHFIRRADKLGWWVAKRLSPMMKIRVLALAAVMKVGDAPMYNPTYSEMHKTLSEGLKRG